MGFVTAIQNYINYHVLILFSLFVKHGLKPKMNECMKHHVHHLTPRGDQDRISPYDMNTTSSRQVARI